MILRQLEEELFSEWEKDNEVFVRDGVVDHKRYKLSERKIIYV